MQIDCIRFDEEASTIHTKCAHLIAHRRRETDDKGNPIAQGDEHGLAAPGNGMQLKNDRRPQRNQCRKDRGGPDIEQIESFHREILPKRSPVGPHGNGKREKPGDVPPSERVERGEAADSESVRSPIIGSG
ncbi:TPA: hypothetical protein DCS34_04370 [Candidatus Peribacteria bacterium]|nr:hypothetical protein [Candidatus Peribacteria bacterium]